VQVATYIAVVIGAYLIGSIPTGAIVARVYRNVDLTTIGSARTGATNTARVLGPGAGLVVLLGDWAKGALAVFLAREIVGTDIAMGLAGFAAVIGHTKSLFLGGKGGRGVVTGLGGLAIAATGLFVVATLTGCIVAAISRYISLGSIAGAAGAILATIVAYAGGGASLALLVYVVATAGYIIFAHADNIERLRAGTERRVGGRATNP
jgi:acyl phosphate:glycerol-3-phosphate acyltransferase